jgi:uncharacterized protein
MIHRILANKVKRQLDFMPAVALLGPRQVGKTTIAKQLAKQIGLQHHYLDLESTADMAKLSNAEDYLKTLAADLVIIDEVQRMPALFPILRSVIDAERRNGRFLLLGSASPQLLAQSSETLAGRLAYSELSPFFLQEVFDTPDAMPHLWLRGGFPHFFLAQSDDISFKMRQQFISTYLERELLMLGLSASPQVLRRLLTMLMHLHGQLLNYASLSNAMGIDVKTLHRYLDFFESSFIIRRLQPWVSNTGKRLVKSSRVYICDSGIYHALAGLCTQEELAGHPGRGASWEGFVMQQIVPRLKPGINAFFYRTQDGSGLDLLLEKDGKPVLGLEIKASNAPSITKGTTNAAKQLGEIPIWVVTPAADEDYRHNEWVGITSINRLEEKLSIFLES